eukprot:gene31161-37659_t
MADRGNSQKLSRSVQISPTIKENEKVPESSSDTISTSNSGALRYNNQFKKPSIANNLRFPELSPLNSLRNISDSQSYKPTPHLAVNTIFPDLVYLQQLLLRFRYTEPVARGVYRAAVTEDYASWTTPKSS